jgi:4'-phosphopantetheinyl transferase
MIDGIPFSDIGARKTVDVWIINLNESPVELEKLESLLSTDEQIRAHRFKFRHDAHQFRLCRALLRTGLAWQLGISPQEVQFREGRRGKPMLQEGQCLHFNVSHSGGVGLIAFTAVGEVGVDVEAVQQEVEAMEIGTANFTSREASMIAAAATDLARARMFTRLWTRKEALLKATGAGLQDGLDEFDISDVIDRPIKFGSSLGSFCQEHWFVRDIEISESFYGAIAAPVGEWSVHCWQVDPREVLGSTGRQF